MALLTEASHDRGVSDSQINVLKKFPKLNVNTRERQTSVNWLTFPSDSDIVTTTTTCCDCQHVSGRAERNDSEGDNEERRLDVRARRPCRRLGGI